VSGENYNIESAMSALSDCITPIKLQGWLLDYEGLIVDYLKLLSQNKQQLATESFETMPKINQQFTASEQLILFPIK
jgi:hypothetical protein